MGRSKPAPAPPTKFLNIDEMLEWGEHHWTKSYIYDTRHRGVAPGNLGQTYTFTVTNVAKSGLTYDAAANVETTDSIIVP